LQPYTIPFARLGRHDVATVGGKNSSLGEMIAQLAAAGVSVPGGFATTAAAFRDFLAHDYLADLLSKQNTPGIGIRVFITDMHTGSPVPVCTPVIDPTIPQCVADGRRGRIGSDRRVRDCEGARIRADAACSR